jgi:hypothetical protein
MYELMWVGALLLTATTLPLAWEIARRPAPGLPGSYVASVTIGLLLCFVLGAGICGYMAQGTGHSVGAVGGHLTLFGWNRASGDLRIAHFLGIHAQQAIPILGLRFRLHRRGGVRRGCSLARCSMWALRSRFWRRRLAVSR